MPRSHHFLIVQAVLAVASLILAGLLLYYFLSVFGLIPVSLTVVAQVLVAAVVGYVAISFVARALRSLTSRTFGVRPANAVSVAFRLVAYAALALFLLALIGVSGTALLAGGTFAGLVIGLAGTTVLSNIMGGILLLVAHPFEVGDRVTVTTWQYGMVVPVYPPRFYSDDRFIPGYTGVVQDLSLAYTSLKLDEGPSMKIPNNVMVQAAILKHSTPRWVRSRFEVPGHPDPERLIDAVEAAVRRNPWIVDPARVRVTLQALTPTSTVLAVDALCKSAFEDEPRSSILIDISRAVSSVRTPES